jgi:cyclic beta-1,2-glucan synthetase
MVQGSQNVGAPAVPQNDPRATVLAERLKDARLRKGSFPIPGRLKKLKDLFQSAYNYFESTSKTAAVVPPASDWLLDNYYILEQALRLLEEDLPAAYYARLPKTADGRPRIQIISMALGQGAPRLDLDQTKHFVHSFQSVTPLQVGELWALPLLLRLTVLETLADGLAEIARLSWESAADLAPWKEVESAADQHAPDADTRVIHSILNLRFISSVEWKDFFEETSVLNQILLGDPAGMYAGSDFETRDLYRSIVEQLSRGSSMSEFEVARETIVLAASAGTARDRHVGFYLIAEGRAILEKRIQFHPTARRAFLRMLRGHPMLAYVGSITLITLSIVAFMVLYTSRAHGSDAQIMTALLLTILPASAIAVQLVNWLAGLIVPPSILPKLELKNGVPSEYRTMIVIPALLGTEKDVSFLTRQIENHFVANHDPNLFFALLTDFADAPEKTMPQDGDLLAQAVAKLKALNASYGTPEYQPFYLFHRERIWNAGEESWMGWERKRGKLEEFNELLRGSRETTYTTQIGNLSQLSSIRYVITLDADTLLPRDSARRLVGTLAHVLNRAVFDPGSDTVKAGYTILQPRVQVRPAVVNQSLFTRTYAGDAVIDLYSRAVSDVYQDLFGEGNFVGKGIYDVDAFRRSLNDKVPENRLLSHDLFEALQGRCGLVTDVTLFEDYPPHYLAYTDRLNRWIRGDWQLLPWLGRWVPHRMKGWARNTLAPIDRWRIFDNLRRSLVPISILALLVTGWLYLPGSRLVWTLMALAAYIVPIITSTLSELRRNLSEEYPNFESRSVRLTALRSFFEVLFLPHEAFVHLDAIATTIHRLYITHKRMLQWVTAAHSLRVFGKTLQVKSAWQAMVITPLFSVALGLIILLQGPNGMAIAALFLVGWVFSPTIAARISIPDRQPEVHLTPAQEKKLRLLARSTWLYFEHFVGPEDRWLPPDHYQESPRGRVQHQTSPTNIGLMLLSTLAAHDMGYMGTQELSLRLRDSFDTLESMERLRGHFLNWYDTRSLAPLPPRYISTVDSGNLAACLLTLKHACLDRQDSPIVHWQGLADTIDMLLFVLERSGVGKSAAEFKKVIESLRDQAGILANPDEFSPERLVKLLENGQQDFEDMLWKSIQSAEEEPTSKSLQELSTWVGRVRYQLRHIRTDIQVLAPWLVALAEAPKIESKPGNETELAETWNQILTTFSQHPKLGEIPHICGKVNGLIGTLMDLMGYGNADAFNWLDVLSYDLNSAQKLSTSLLEEFASLASRAETMFNEMSFSFLYDSNRRVFHIGYNVEAGRMDPNYYDLLASESRISSLVAIARGDVPQEHWLHLSRPLTEVNGKQTLLSWSGTMFEYLMPTLLLKSYPDTLLDQSCRAAVEQQMTYAAEKNIPWGISESAYYNFDANQIYQYQAFGVPKLGYKRGLSDHLVVTPYASLLALPFAPREVLKNLSWFEKNNMWASYGLYESVDFTPERLKMGEEYAIVQSYMAHHQGMILLALYNWLNHDRMVHRLHADSLIRSVDLLLQEQPPVNAPTEHPRPQPMETASRENAPVALEPWRVSPDASYPQLHCLSNGNYTVLICASGSGFSRWNDLDLTRWRADPTHDNWGTWIYVEDRMDGRLWSVTPQPVMAAPHHNETVFLPHRVEFERQDEELLIRTIIAVAPEDDVEIRRVTLTNHGNLPRLLALTSYAEIILAQQSADIRHPAFNKMFIESEFLPDEKSLLFHRRPRSEDEKPVYLLHFFVSNQEKVELAGYETDRRLFLGRGGTDRRPAVFTVRNEASTLSRTTGATLDPICALQAEIALAPYETVHLAFVTIAAGSRQEALQLAYRYRRWSQIGRSLSDSQIEAARELAQLGVASKEVERFQKLLSPLIYPSAAIRADRGVLASNTLGQSGLWSYGVSGDYPILLVRLNHEQEIGLLHEILLAYTYWHRRGLMIDVVIMNRLETGYDQGLQGRILRAVSRSGVGDQLNKRGGIFILHEDQMNEQQRVLLQTAARVVINGDAGSLEEQVARLDTETIRLPPFVPIEQPSVDPLSPVSRPADLQFDNGLGGFSPDGREYLIHLPSGQWTPSPWVNVIGTPRFGCIVSESGLGYSWAGNSGENRLTPWRNDAVSDIPSEAVYLRDEDTGEVWSPTPLPARAEAPYLVRHGNGYSIFEHISHGLHQRLRVFVTAREPVKIVQLKLENKSGRIRRINATYYAEWVLGTTREDTAPYIIPEFSSGQFALLARNPYNPDFPSSVAFLATTREPNGMTADRLEFLGRHGSYAHPAALERVGMTPRVEAGNDPCGAINVLLWLQPGETKEVTFLLGEGVDRAESERLIGQYQNIDNVQAAWEEMCQFWNDLLGQVEVETPDKSLDLLLNRWLLYQSLSSRYWGRTGFYQSSGAFGFRDQLQDALAYVHTQPGILRAHLLDAAQYQFEEGDVLHWWHPPTGRGIRTRCSDDLLWLPFVTAHYVESTGDVSILSEIVPFLKAEPLKPDEHERYGQFPVGASASLYEHCCRAIAKGTTAGVHGLPLIGAHDWNDGLSSVGDKGKGESVWLAWFLAKTLKQFAGTCEHMQDQKRADVYRNQAERILAAVDASAWDGEWYRRAYYDDGSPLGSKQNLECQIDSLGQSWAVIAGGGDPGRVKKGMESADRILVDGDDKLIRLLTPPFDKTVRNPGYIKGYPPGIRENGGQYTHASLWLIWAFADLGQTDRAYGLFNLINPIHHAAAYRQLEQYRVEPYVVAADVYSTPPHNGRGGWTWYTGSASWMYRLGLERLLGIVRKADHLEIHPCIPKDWKGYQVNYRFGKTLYHIRIENSHGGSSEVKQMMMDGKNLPGLRIPLQADARTHEVVVTLK